MKKFALAGLCTALLLFVGCASGPKFNAIQNKIAPLNSQKCRIYFYRTTVIGAAVQPEVRLNNAVVGTAKPKGIFFADVDPGKIEVATATEVEKKLTFTTSAGDTRYVKLTMHIGLMVGRCVPELVDENKAKEELSDLHFIGNVENN